MENFFLDKIITKNYIVCILNLDLILKIIIYNSFLNIIILRII
jgi:hypothetical protein